MRENRQKDRKKEHKYGLYCIVIVCTVKINFKIKETSKKRSATEAKPVN